jgi:hypothetical protein
MMESNECPSIIDHDFQIKIIPDSRETKREKRKVLESKEILESDNSILSYQFEYSKSS